MAAATEGQRGGQTTAFVALAELTPEDDLAAAVVQALGLQLTPDANPVEQLLAYLRQKTMLLVLDNFEHLLESAPLLAQIHQVAPAVTLLVTSCERLRLPGEQLLPLQGLAYPGDERCPAVGRRRPAVIFEGGTDDWQNMARVDRPGERGQVRAPS